MSKHFIVAALLVTALYPMRTSIIKADFEAQADPQGAAQAQKTTQVHTEENSRTTVRHALSDEIRPQLALSEKVAKTAKSIFLTAYSSDPEQTDDTPFITASGSTVRDGIVATNLLPFGTKVMFPELFGNKVFTVEDRMAARFKDRMDIWMNSRSEALKFGLRTAKYIIVDQNELAMK